MKNKFLATVIALFVTTFWSHAGYCETVEQIAVYGAGYNYWRVMRTADQGEIRNYFVYGNSDMAHDVAGLNIYRLKNQNGEQALTYVFDVQEGDWRTLRSRVFDDGKKLSLVFRFDDGTRFNFDFVLFTRVRYMEFLVGQMGEHFFQMLKLSRSVTVDVLLTDSNGVSDLYYTYDFKLTGTNAALNRMMSEPF